MDRSAVAGLAIAAGLALVACGGGAGSTASATGTPPQAAGSGAAPEPPPAQGAEASLSAEGMDDCERVTAADIHRVTGYDAVEQRGYGSGCGYATPDGRFSVTAVGGRYVDLRSSLGGTHVPLPRGLTGYVGSTGWITTVIYPDETSVSLVISGSAFSQPDSREDMRVRLADGREVEAATLYRAFAEAVVANSR